MRKILAMMVAVAVSAPAAFAQDDAGAKKPGVDIGVDVASTYAWRGIDIYGVAKAAAKAEKESAFSTVPAIQPSITFNSPVEGLSFNIWASYAASDRSSGSGPKSFDEIDYTMGYEFDNSIGSFAFALIYYSFPSITGGTYGELNFGYTAPLPLNPTFGVAVGETDEAIDNSSGYQYLTFGLSHGIEMGAISIEPGVTFAYWTFANSNANWGHIDVSVPIGYAISDSLSVHVTPTGILRFTNGNSLLMKTDYTVATTPATTEQRPKFVALVTAGVSYSL